MSLVEYARAELQRAGMFDKDADYGGELGPIVMQLMQHFADGGHSGGSAQLALELFERLARYRPLTPIDNPLNKHEYVDHGNVTDGDLTYQSTRLSSLFSEDGGKSWYDIDLPIPRWKRWFGARRAYVVFPYTPK
jgi:hypothetical protein